MLERNNKNIEIIFLSSNLESAPIASPEAVLSTDEKIASGSPSGVEQIIDSLNNQAKEINTGLKDISQQILNIEKDVSGIVSKAKIIENRGERKVMFQDIIIGTDIDYGLNEGGIKQEITLKNKEKLINTFVFTLTAPDMKYRNVGGGVWYFSDQNDKDIMRISKGWAEDKKGAINNDVEVKLEPYLWINKLIITIPQDWLESSDREFPIVINTGIEVVPELRDGKNI